MITLQNPGLIDLDTIKIMGVNVKPNSRNPIGYFGTGSKYAIATVLRLGGAVTLYRGLEQYEFRSTSRPIRGQEFQVIEMIGPTGTETLAFTLDLGKNWEAWMAFREFYSNCIDEGGHLFLGASAPSADSTTFHIKGLDEAAAKRAEIFLEGKTKAWSNDSVEVHKGSSLWIYYRGVRAMKLQSPSIYTYNLLSSITLTEDRTIKDSWTVAHRLAIALCDCNDRDLLRRVLTQAGDKTFEWNLDFDWGDFNQYSEEFWEVVSKATRGCNPSAKRAYLKRYPAKTEHQGVTLKSHQQKILDKAIQAAGEMGFPIGDYKISVVSDLGQGVLGQAKDGQCYISIAGLQMGVRQLTATLIEEYIHLHHYLQDGREMQDFLLNQLVTMAEEHILGEPL